MNLPNLLLYFDVKLSEQGAQSQPEKKQRALGLSYLIDENPPWYICLLLGFQVSIDMCALFRCLFVCLFFCFRVISFHVWYLPLLLVIKNSLIIHKPIDQSNGR